MPQTVVGHCGVGTGEFDQSDFALTEDQSWHGVERRRDAESPGLTHDGFQSDPTGQSQGSGVVAEREGAQQRQFPFARTLKDLTLPVQLLAVQLGARADAAIQSREAMFGTCSRFVATSTSST